MTLDEARARIGERVRYTTNSGRYEYGEITGVNGRYVIVRYDGDRHGKATSAGMLAVPGS